MCSISSRCSRRCSARRTADRAARGRVRRELRLRQAGHALVRGDRRLHRHPRRDPRGQRQAERLARVVDPVHPGLVVGRRRGAASSGPAVDSVTIRSSQKARWARTPATVQPASIGPASCWSLSLSVRARSRSSCARFSATYDRSAAMDILPCCDGARAIVTPAGARVKRPSVAAPPDSCYTRGSDGRSRRARRPASREAGSPRRRARLELGRARRPAQPAGPRPRRPGICRPAATSSSTRRTRWSTTWPARPRARPGSFRRR